MNPDPGAKFDAVGGRKFLVTMTGISIVTGLALVTLFLGRINPATDAAITAVGAMVLAFITGNAAVTWGAMRAVERRESNAQDAPYPGYVRLPDTPDKP